MFEKSFLTESIFQARSGNGEVVMASRKVVNIGAQQFDRLIEENKFYIDKTGFIREWWETGADVTLITRPRRFGKTLNMSMVECFFSNQLRRQK